MKQAMTLRALHFALLVLAGCQPPMKLSHVMTGRARVAHHGQVAVHMESEAVPAGFREIALVQATAYGNEADLAHVVSGLRDRASILGCTTIVRVRVDQGQTTASANGVCGVLE